MSILKTPSTPWSFESDNETALCAFTDDLHLFAQECVKQPGETSALNACGATRNVWDTAEGMIHADLPIDNLLLRRAINGIAECISAVAQIQSSFAAAPEITSHLERMVAAMTERHGDLLVLLNEGKMAFKRRLQTDRTAIA